MSEYLLHDSDKAAFINKMNKLLNQIKPNLELNSETFIDIPGSGDEDMCVFVTEDPIEEKMLDLMIDKHKFSYKIKKVHLKGLVDSVKNK